ncbi:MAG: outer membrane beta-barrel protein [Gammaproteobacteria bacterium]|nr:outer membrane beta-barrel protein [Gammaproteobacteria bacterium]
MKQSIAWAVLLILVPCFVHAGGEGLYVGAHADFQHYELDELGFDDDDSGLSFGVYAGFGKEVGNGFYAAFEVEGNTGGNQVEDTITCAATGADTSLRYRREGSLGAHVLLGKAVPVGRLYLKAGRVRTKFNIKDDAGCLGSNRGDGYENGNSLGIGYDYDLNEQWSVRGEYSHIGYESDGGDDDILRLGVVFRL